MSSFPEDAIAIVGAACRLPGGISDLSAFWTALAEGRDLVTTVPPDRFDAARLLDHGQLRTTAGGFLEDIAGFDADFFGVSPREASRLDPQQRLMLELTVEAVDDAGYDRRELAGSDTAVFVGLSSHDYWDLQAADNRSMNAYTMAGGVACNAANRVSYFMDWHGESEAVDTACSSALTALHRGCEQLRAGLSRSVLVGAAQMLISPLTQIGFASAGLLSPSGRCRTFSAEADGYVRSEGGGVVLLKRLRDAVSDGDRVHAVVLATGANSDGRTAGLSLPNSAAQEALLRDVYTRAGVAPDELVYVEAHGTGTPAGDPIECSALSQVLARRRSPVSGPLPIGSVKSNLGHLEPGAGMAGLLKAILVLRHGRIPRTLHAENLNPNIPFEDWRLEPVRDVRSFRPADRPVVGVNSFGFGGANAHVVLTSTAVGTALPPQQRRHVPVIVSGRTPQAVAQAAARMAERLTRADTPGSEDFHDLAYTSSCRRGHHEHRAVVLAADTEDAAAGMRALAVGEQPTATAVDEAMPTGRIAFVFSGNGSQWAGMGADLLASEPVFRTAVEEVDAELAGHLGWSVADALSRGADDPARLAATEVAQPLLFAVQVGLVALLKSAGITPSAVLGHSIGEVAAAYTAGALDLPAAALVLASRGQCQRLTAGQGRMAAVGLSEDAARTELSTYDGRLEIAGVNSAQDVTLTGPEEDLRHLERALSPRGVFFRMLDLDYAFHSRFMDPLRESLRTALAGLRPGRPAIPFASTVTGLLCDDDDVLDAAYWWRNVREPVRFAGAVESVLIEGCDLLVEIGPHPVLATYLKRLAASSASPAAVVATCRRQADGPAAVRDAIARLLASGAPVDRTAFFPQPRRVVELPAYAWQRDRHWNGEPSWWNSGGGGGEPCAHPLLGDRLPTADPVWSGPLRPAGVPWLGDHQVEGSVVLPAAAYLEMAFAAARENGVDGPVEVQHFAVTKAMIVPWEERVDDVQAQVSLTHEGRTLRVTSRQAGEGDWREHAKGQVRPLLRPRPADLDITGLRTRLGPGTAPDGNYRVAAEAGLDLGPAFQVLTDVFPGEREALAAFRCALPADGYRAHPTLLDGVLQAGLFAGLHNGLQDDALMLPAAIDTVRLWHDPPAQGWVHARCREVSPFEASYDLTATDEHGRVVLEIEGCRLRRVERVTTAPQRLETVLRAAPKPSEPFVSALPSPSRLLAASAAARAAVLARHRDTVVETRRHVRLLQAHFVAQAMADILPGRAELTVTDLLEAGVRPEYTRLCRVLLALAAEHGLLEMCSPATPRGGPGGGAAEDRWRVLAPGHPEDALATALRTGHRQDPSAFTLYSHCGARLADVLCGRLDAMDLLFSEADRHLLEQLYTEVTESRLHNETARELLRAAVASWPAGQPLRILEVGGGTGATTAALLEVLPRDRTRYTFTDVSASFLPRAQAQFSDYDFVEHAVLDLDRDPVEQGFAEGSFDLIVASNVLHATADLRTSLGHVRQLLAPRGQLLATEIHDPRTWVGVFGLLDSFWSFQDTGLRTDSPLMTAPQWADLLADCGFTDVRHVGETPEPAALEQSVMLARRSEPSTWPPREPVCPPEKPVHWVLLAEDATGGLARTLAGALGDGAGAQVSVVDARAAQGGLPALIPDDADQLHVVFLLDEDPNAAADAHAALDEAVRRLGVLAELATCEQLVAAQAAELSVITRPSGALPAPEASTHVRDAAVWGAARTFANEHPSVVVRRISLERGPDQLRDARRLVRELSDPADEVEVVLTAGGRFVPRLVALRAVTEAPDAGHDKPYRLELRKPALTPHLAWIPEQPPAPGPDEVLIDVRAVGLNYHDAMVASGLMPPGADEGAPDASRLGLECAGVITSVGSAVTEFAPGDRVFAIMYGALSSQVIAHRQLVGKLPEGMDFAAAATLPLVYLTVHHGLRSLAQVAPGETILVHGGAGGVGLAVVDIARACGAQVIATAGTPAKRNLLSLLGVEHVLDSRSLTFADDVRRVTDGAGVDIVVNSLAGEALTRSLELLRAGGRFIELGKRDVYANAPLPMRLLRDNISVFVVDIARLAALTPEVAGIGLREVTRDIHEKLYSPVLHTTFSAAQVQRAVHTLQHSRHVGKIVVDLGTPPPVERATEPAPLDPAGTYLVVGGLSGLGAETVHWLVEHGVRRLALVGRRGALTPGAAELLADLADHGVHVVVHAVDVTDAQALRGILKEADAEGHPVRGVVHSAMHTDDGPLKELTEDRIRAVLAPKFLGVTLLDELTGRTPLDLFVGYSSISAVIGNLGQSAYCAGNLYIEALMRRRRQSGRPGLAVAWGVIGETGFTARDQRLSDRLSDIGIRPMAPSEACVSLGELLATERENAVVGHFDWPRMRQVMPTTNTPLFTEGVAWATQESEMGGTDLRQRLAGLPADEALATVADVLAAELARVLGLQPDRVDRSRPLDQLGLDSLMSTELVVAVRRRLGCDLPSLEVMTATDLHDLARRTLPRLRPRTAASSS
ncbi:SDR family NAD(P)-dependent oxidoreductase [Streptomyces niveiscabiei]|uniref:SDR family NAD(P)-dependent oxidoreductase n=1 Tax=Streptomyces niveiscabiei TaxID=164115 RepID=A0ABW9HGC5_9ACTN